MQVNYIEVLALLLLLLAAPLVFLNWLFGGHTASLLACWKLFRQGACAAAAEMLVTPFCTNSKCLLPAFAGALKYSSFCVRPVPQVNGFRIVQCNKHSDWPVFSTSHVTADCSLWHILTGGY